MAARTVVNTCEYEKGIGCDLILVQPWYACEIASRWSSMRSEIRSEIWPSRASLRMVAWHQPITISGRRRTWASSSFSFGVSTSLGTRSRSWFSRQSCINSAKNRRSKRCKRWMASSASGVPGRMSVLKTMRRISERLWLRTAPTCPRACQERACII